MSVVASEFLTELKEKMKNDSELLKKAFYVKEMLEKLPKARIQFFENSLIGNKGKGWNDHYFVLEYQRENVKYVIDIDISDNTKTQVILKNRYDHDNPTLHEENQVALKEKLNKNGIDLDTEWETDSILRFAKDFDFPKDDDIVVKVVKEIDFILSNWEKE